MHLVHRGAEENVSIELLETRTSTITWHSDVTYEAQPPGTTFLYILDTPDQGGDTLFSSQVEAYNRLSSEFQKRLHGLTALHSGKPRKAITGPKDMADFIFRARAGTELKDQGQRCSP